MSKAHNDGEHQIGDTVERVTDSYCGTYVGTQGTVIRIENGLSCKQVLYLEGKCDGMKGDRFKTIKRGKKMKIERKYKAKDNIVAVAPCDGQSSYVGQIGKIHRVYETNTVCPYLVHFETGVERWCEESSLRSLTKAQIAKLKDYMFVTSGGSKYMVKACNATELDVLGARYLKSYDKLDVFEIKKVCTMAKEIVVKRQPV